jgi:hypothetical protein
VLTVGSALTTSVNNLIAGRAGAGGWGLAASGRLVGRKRDPAARLAVPILTERRRWYGFADCEVEGVLPV